MQRLYVGLISLLIAAMLVAVLVVPPSRALGFGGVANFDLAFAIGMAGMLMTLFSNLATALYRARGLYGRAVWVQCAAMLVSQIAQVIKAHSDKQGGAA